MTNIYVYINCIICSITLLQKQIHQHIWQKNCMYIFFNEYKFSFAIYTLYLFNYYSQSIFPHHNWKLC